MSAWTAQLATATGMFPDRITDERLEDSDDLLGALGRERIFEERLEDYQRGIKDEGFFTGVRPRGHEDLAHFEQNWTDSRRDVYRFTAF